MTIEGTAPPRAARRNSAPLMKGLLDAPMMMRCADAEGSVTFVNRKWLTFTGRRLRDELGDGWTQSLHPDDLGRCLEAYRAAVSDQRPLWLEYRIRRADNVYRWICDFALPMHEENGDFAGFMGTCADVTAQRQGRPELDCTVEHPRTRQVGLEHERDAQIAMLHGLIAHMTDGVLAETAAGRIAVVNRAFERIFELPSSVTAAGGAAGLHAMVLERLSNPDACCPTAAAAPGHGLPLGELRLKDGRTIEQDHFSVRLEDARVIHVWQFRDITVRKREDEELRASRHRLRELSAHLETAREEERRELVRTLHDEVGQLLTGIRLEIASAVDRFRQIGTADEFPIVDRLQAAVGLVDLSIATVQRVTSALRPPMLEHLGLIEAIRWEAAVFERRTGIRCRVSATRARIDNRRHTNILYRILLEALTNVARHANAGTVWITLRQRAGHLVMEVRDNGRGISDEALGKADSMGLFGMRERALAAGGQIRINRTPAGGTTVAVNLPVDAEAARGVAADVLDA